METGFLVAICLLRLGVMLMAVSVILLDIGGVIVALTGVKRLIELLGNKITPDELTRRWIASKYVTLFETGQCDAQVFSSGVIDELHMDITSRAFIDEFRLFTKGFYKGATGLLKQIHPRFMLACLSNTNAIQWESLRDRIGIHAYFQHCFLSYEIGVLKPDSAAYEHAIQALACQPEDIAFFDDNANNIRAAKQMGMCAYQVVGVEQLRNALNDLHFLS